jgi:hypothetical protein
MIEIEKDGRVRPVMHGGLIATPKGIGLVCYVCKRIFFLDKMGKFQDVLPLEEVMVGMDRVTHVAPWQKQTYLVTWRKDNQELVSIVDFQKKTSELVFQYDKGFIFTTDGETTLAIHGKNRKIAILDHDFQHLRTLEIDGKGYAATAKQAIQSKLFKSLTLINAIVIEGKTYLTWNEKVKSDHVLKSVYLDGGKLIQSEIKPLAKSPDGKWFLVRNYALDGELQILTTSQAMNLLSK